MENINSKGNIIDRKNKRKLQNEELQEQENEEEKVEQFFALIRNTKEMHDRLRNSEGLKEEKEKEMEQEKKAAKVSAAWNPTFQPEDFTEGDINNINASKNFFSENQQVGSSSKIQENEEEKEKAEARKEANNELDLKLSL
ncbi:hypothetical protein AB3S75_031492 [Citrus x aurantiifolia]